MIDTRSVNLLLLCGRDTNLKHIANTRGGEYCGACPLCGGEDRFRVQPATGLWCCRQCHERWGDAIEYVRWHDGVDFKRAIEILNLPLDSRPFNPTIRTAVDRDAPKPLGSEYAALNDENWQVDGYAFVIDCWYKLWSQEADKVRSYLLARGISEEIMLNSGLGYNPTDYKAMWGETDIWLPRGIIIPWMIDGRLWRVNCRPPVPVNGKKYIQAAGSANGLYNADAIRRFRTVIMTEGEFDSLVIRSQTSNFVAVATGTVSWARVTRWVSRLNHAGEILLAFDTDEAGESAVLWWQRQLGDKATRIIPTEHDVTDMWKSGQSIVEWLEPFNMSFSRFISKDMESRRQISRDEILERGYKLVDK